MADLPSKRSSGIMLGLKEKGGGINGQNYSLVEDLFRG